MVIEALGASERTRFRRNSCNLLPSEIDARVLLCSSLSFRFFRIVKEQPIHQYNAKHAIGALGVALEVPGGANRDRTGDLLLAKQALSQLSYGPGDAGWQLVGLDGFEPSTPALSRRCSNQLSYRPSRLSVTQPISVGASSRGHSLERR